MEHSAAAEAEISLRCLLNPLGSENCSSLIIDLLCNTLVCVWSFSYQKALVIPH